MKLNKKAKRQVSNIIGKSERAEIPNMLNALLGQADCIDEVILIVAWHDGTVTLRRTMSPPQAIAELERAKFELLSSVRDIGFIDEDEEEEEDV